MMKKYEIDCIDNNCSELHERYGKSLHFAVGDTHGDCQTLINLMAKIAFDPSADHIYFVGDYNSGSNVPQLLQYLAEYYQPDYRKPGFHLIRGNHERELSPLFRMPNQPDILVVRGKYMNFFFVHAGMVASAFDLICDDMTEHPDQQVFAYRLERECVCLDAPLRQINWSRRGMYSQHSRWKTWPTEEKLLKEKACIIHGHTPYHTVFLYPFLTHSFGFIILWLCQVLLYSITKEVTAELYKDTELMDTFVLSPSEYVNAVITETTSYNTFRLLAATAPYGYAAEEYFDDAANRGVTDHIDMYLRSLADVKNPDDIAELLDRLTPYAAESDALGKENKVSMVLNSKVKLRVYSDKGTETSECSGTCGKYSEVTGLTLLTMGQTQNIDGYDVSGFTWVYRVLANDQSTPRDVNMAKALYLYMRTARSLAPR